MPHDIAIVGMSCRFPGAPDLHWFWKNNLEGRVSLRELGDHRWDHSAIHDPDIRAKNRTHTRTAGLLHDIDRFAARHFRVSPRRLRVMDPQQRLALELAREALQDAGHELRPFERNDSAVFIGASVSEFANLASLKMRSVQLARGQFGERCEADVSRHVPDANSYTMAGSLVNVIASGVAQSFGLGGPALTVDAACASALAAVVHGCNHLRTLPPREGTSPLVLAGGVYLMLNPENAICFAKLGALAERECRPFDAAADGFILGEGGGMVVLKRLADARADGDRIYALIKGAAWNNDGGSSSPMTPSRDGQARVLRRGFAVAGMSSSEIGYVECHGTATPAGDVVELGALGDVWEGAHRPALGSVKANIGHTLSAAGAAGLIRAALALHQRVLPPQAAWRIWHPKLEPYADRFSISTEPAAWHGPEGATVSAFGFGGTNCFLVLQGEGRRRAVSRRREPLLLGFFAPTGALLETYLESCERAMGGQDLSAVASALAARAVERIGLFVKASTLREALGAMRRARRRLDGAGDGMVEEEGLLVGPTEAVAALREGPWAGAALWCAGEPPVLGVPPGELPPSPLERISSWPLEKLPGPRSEDDLSETPEPEDGLQLLDLASHPYLADHCLKGRPFLPLAAALDYMVETLGLLPPFGLEEVKVGRGLLVRDRATFKVVRQGERVELREVRPGGREVVAFEAHTAAAPNGMPRVGPSPAGRPRLDLEEFYRRFTFHGPTLQGILRIEGVEPELLEVEVATSRPSEWSLTDPRSRWSLDPLVIDSAFQAAVYWTQMESGRGLLPLSIERLEVWREFPARRVRVRVERRGEDGKGVLGDFIFCDGEEPCARLSGVRAAYYDYN